jgi:hypothetical protein
MEIFFKSAPSLDMSEYVAISLDAQTDFESLPNGSAAVVNELVRIGNERNIVLL